MRARARSPRHRPRQDFTGRPHRAEGPPFEDHTARHSAFRGSGTRGLRRGRAGRRGPATAGHSLLRPLPLGDVDEQRVLALLAAAGVRGRPVPAHPPAHGVSHGPGPQGGMPARRRGGGRRRPVPPGPAAAGGRRGCGGGGSGHVARTCAQTGRRSPLQGPLRGALPGCPQGSAVGMSLFLPLPVPSRGPLSRYRTNCLTGME